MSFARFMSGPLGRIIRVVAGLGISGYGLAVVGGSAGAALGAVGLLPVAAGALNFCLFAPLFGGPFSGRKALEQG